MPYADNQGIRIYYQTEGEGLPLVLQHWSLATMDDWYDYGYVSALMKDCRLILLDARGHGASDKPHVPEAYHLKNRVEDIVAVLDDLGVAQADFLGYSMGGWIGFGVARYTPERFRSLIIGGQHPYVQNMAELRELVQYGAENGPEAFVAMWEENFGALSPKKRDRMLTYDYEALLILAQDRDSLEDVLPSMRMTCLLLAGEKDEVYPMARECAVKITNATFVGLPGLDHGETIEQIDVVLPHIKKFLAALNQEMGVD